MQYRAAVQANKVSAVEEAYIQYDAHSASLKSGGFDSKVQKLTIISYYNMELRKGEYERRYNIKRNLCGAFSK